MKKFVLLAGANLRKAKGQTTAIVALILLAALMLNLWLMLSLDYKQNFDRCHERLHAEHVTLAVDGDSVQLRDFLEKTLEEDRRTADYSMDEAMHMVGMFAYNGGEVNSELVFLDKETALSRSVGRVEILEEGDIQSGIYMPVLYRSEEIEIGKTIQVSIGSQEVSYKVCGFFNSVMAGSHNCAMCQLILTRDKYDELEELGYAPKSTLCSVRLNDRAESEDFEAALKNAVSFRFPQARSVSNSYALVSKSRYISQMICSGILSAMAFFILLIALIVIGSNIINYIQENMKNLGALKAIGYTSRQLKGALQVQLLGLSLLAALTGTGISYIVFPFINTMMISQTGIPYRIRFLPVPFLMTLGILGGAVALAVWFSSRRIGRTEPVTAFRQGVATHNFKRDHLPLEKTGAPLQLALALKTTLSGIRHNVTICFTMLVLSLVLVFSGLMTRNVIIDMDPFINLIVGETADSCINISAEAEEAFLEEMMADRRVEKVYLYNSLEVRHVNGAALIVTMSEDFAHVNNTDIVFEGRFPRYDNEIVIAAKYAGEKGLQLGDEITITAQGEEADFVITGFTQISNNLGKDCLLTRQGYQRLGSLQNASYYLNLAKDVDIDGFNTDVKEQFGDQVNAVINIGATVEGAASVYVALMTMIVAAILVLSVLVIAFVLYLLVRTMLSSKKREYGILKALGFTTGQLVLQTALVFMPAVTVSTAVGMTICCLVINPLTALFLRPIGIVKCTFIVPAGYMAAAGVGLILMAFGIACLMSLKVRKIAPRALLAGEE